MVSYDLSHPLEAGMQTYPGDPPVEIEPHADFETDGYRVTTLSLGSHSGTHVDAPSHTQADGATLGSYGPDAFRFDAQLADVRLGARAPIGVADLPDATDADLLVLHTGWDDHWGTARALDHPFLTRAAAEWCVDHGYDVATDALSVDPTPSPSAEPTGPTESTDPTESTGFAAHDAILGAGRLIYENLTGLARLPPRFELHAYPLALDGDGAPVRAVALTDD
jgi:kynurenine formamidase